MAGIVNLNPENFRALIRRHGEPVVWQQSVECNCYRAGSSAPPQKCGVCEQGLRYTTMPLDAAVRAWIGAMQKTVQDPELGLITKGTTTIAAMFDELPLSIGDKITLPRRIALHKEALTRGDGNIDLVSRGSVVAVQSISQVDIETNEVTTFQAGVDYLFGGSDVLWVPGGNAPTQGSDYSIAFTHRPTYWFLGDLQQEAPPSQFGDVFLPLYGALTLKHPFEGRI